MSGKNEKKQKFSSGLKRSRRARQLLRQVSRKIKRWERYSKEIAEDTRKGNPSRWNTAGLKSHADLLKQLVGKKKNE